jgi:MFS family permease
VVLSINLDKEKFSRRSLILPVYLPALLLAFGQGVVTPTFAIYVKSFSLSYGLTTFVIAVAVVGNLPAGILVERIGRRPSMIVGAMLDALSMLGVGLATNVFQLIIYRLIGGIGGTLWSLSRHAYMTDVIPRSERGRSIALFGGINRIGAFGGQLIAIFLGASLRTPFFVYFAVGGLTSIFCILFISETRNPSASPLSLNLGRLPRLLKTHHRTLLTAGLAQICVQTLRQGRWVVIPLYASEYVELPARTVRLIVMISSAVDMSLFPLAGFLMDRFGRRYSAVPCFFIFATGMVLMPFTERFGTLLGTAILIGFGNGVGSGIMMTLGADLAPKDGTGEFLGVWRLLGDFGGAAGHLLVGNVADLWGLGASSFVLAGIGYIAVMLFLRVVPETLNAER